MILIVLVTCLLVVQGIATSSDCQKKRNQALGITGQDSIAKPMPGRFVPSCTDDGYYNSVQCSGSTGYCWCVDILIGKKIPNTAIRFKTPSCPKTALSECQRRRLVADASGLLGAQRFQCEADGRYKLVQRKGSVCYCVDDQGREVQGSSKTVGQCTNLNCISNFKKCQKERHAGLEILRTKHQYGLFVPQCKGDGSYTVRQCHERYCWCVNTTTGIIIQDTKKVISDGVKPLCSTSQQSKCQKKYKSALRLVVMGLLGVFIPKCKAGSGDFEQIQCLGSINMCWCVDGKSGKALEGTHKIMSDSGKPNCVITECQRQKKKARELKNRKPPLLGVFEPECENNGKFIQKQCHENSCFCVNIETGEKKNGGSVVSRMDKAKLKC